MFSLFKKQKDDIINAEEVIKAEKEYLNGANETDEKKNIWGLAISGGGIRSASIGLGVMQALVAAPDKSLLSRMDYLSTVSGGGYIGSALTWFLHKGLPEGGEAGTDPENFPLGQIGSGARTDRKNLVLNFIRQHGNYLIPGQGLNALSLFGVTVRSIFISLLVYFLIILAVISGLNMLKMFKPFSAEELTGLKIFDNLQLPVFLWFSVLMLIITAAASIIFLVRTKLNWKPARRYKNLILGQDFLGFAWKFILVTSLLGSFVYLPGLIQKLIAGGAISIGTITGIFQYLKSVNSSFSGGSGRLASFGILIAVGILDYGLFLSAYLFGAAYIQDWFYLSIVTAAALLLGFFSNLNYAGLHRMYRDRLMETFMQNADNIKINKWGAATQADTDLLENMNDKHRRPYHLINTNIVLVDSPIAQYRGRGGDSFLLSRLYSGSDATLYVPTKNYMKKRSRGITLSTAMAISGAAVNPNTGAAGKGLMRNRMVSLLLGILNLRLGYWAVNPKGAYYFSSEPNFLVPGLKGDLFGGNLSEDKMDIQLTDGGHFENLALYELFRRKAKVIIVSDGGQDENYSFCDLANAIEKARVDFGITIRFRKDCDLNDLLPGSNNDPDSKFLTEKYKFSKRGFAAADIWYNDTDDTVGKLIYLKPVLTNNLPADIYGYKSANWSFPNQTTADQFFDEQQFEAYRELGYQLTWQMLKSEVGKDLMEAYDN